MGDLGVVHVRELIERQEALVGVEAEVAAVVVGEVPGVTSRGESDCLAQAVRG